MGKIGGRIGLCRRFGIGLVLLMVPALLHAGLYLELQGGGMSGLSRQYQPGMSQSQDSPVEREPIYGYRVGYASKKYLTDFSIGRVLYETKRSGGGEESLLIPGPLTMDMGSAEFYLGFPMGKRFNLRFGAGIAYVAVDHSIADDVYKTATFRGLTERWEKKEGDPETGRYVEIEGRRMTQRIDSKQAYLTAVSLEYAVNKWLSLVGNVRYFNFVTTVDWLNFDGEKVGNAQQMNLESLIYTVGVRVYAF